ncbi:MAG: SDR family oxidoreductase, partial [Conexivisphaera sp.]
GNIAYSSTKGAVAMLTRQLAAEWAPYGVRVNAIGPALVSTETGMGAGLTSSDHVRRYLDSIPMGRIAVPEDIVGVAVFLASKASDFITGQIIYVDGGLTAIG